MQKLEVGQEMELIDFVSIAAGVDQESLNCSIEELPTATQSTGDAQEIE